MTYFKDPAPLPPPPPKLVLPDGLPEPAKWKVHAHIGVDGASTRVALDGLGTGGHQVTVFAWPSGRQETLSVEGDEVRVTFPWRARRIMLRCRGRDTPWCVVEGGE